MIVQATLKQKLGVEQPYLIPRIQRRERRWKPRQSSACCCPAHVVVYQQ